MHNKQQADFLLFPLHKRYTILMVRQRTNQPVLPDLTKSNQLGTTLKHFGHFVKCSFSICPILVNLLCYWENFHWCIWPNNFFKNESSGHTGTSLPSSTGAKKILPAKRKINFAGFSFREVPLWEETRLSHPSSSSSVARSSEEETPKCLKTFQPVFCLLLNDFSASFWALVKPTN